MAKFKKTEGKVGLPKFKAEYSAQLKEQLETLGMGEAFDPNKADFKGMSATEQLFISHVQHKTFVEVNEEGTEAAASTLIVMMPVSARSEPPTPTFRADHPFVFLIRDNQSGLILFLGRVVKPSA